MGYKSTAIRWGIFSLAAAWGCAPLLPKPDPALLGCFRLETDLPASYGDSLGYGIPPVIRLAYSSYGQWIVYPTDLEYHPSWTVWDDLPSGGIRRATGRRSAWQFDSIRMIPGDSIDIIFPSDLGRLVLRLGKSEDGMEGRLAGRAEWVTPGPYYFMNEGKNVVASPTSCRDLPGSLVRTRYR